MAHDSTHLVFVDGVDAQHVKGIALGPLAAKLPLLLLGARQVVGRVDVARLPFAVHLALELAPPLRLDHLARLCRAVEAGFAGKAGGERGDGGSLLASWGVAGGAAAEDGEERLICWASVRDVRGGSRRREGGRTLLLRPRREASQAVGAERWRCPESQPGQ